MLDIILACRFTSNFQSRNHNCWFCALVLDLYEMHTVVFGYKMLDEVFHDDKWLYSVVIKWLFWLYSSNFCLKTRRHDVAIIVVLLTSWYLIFVSCISYFLWYNAILDYIWWYELKFSRCHEVTMHVYFEFLLKNAKWWFVLWCVTLWCITLLFFISDLHAK